MRKKIIVIIISTLLCISGVVFLNNNFEVKANSGGGDGGDNATELPYDLVWTITRALANVTHDRAIYPPGTIPMGRTFGTPGEQWTANFLNETMSDDLGLENVQKLPLGPIKNIENYLWYYTSKVETKDFKLTCNLPDCPDTPTGTIPKNETYTFPSARENQNKQMTYNHTFNNIRIVPKNLTENWYKLGLNINNHLNITCSEINNIDNVTGNVTYIPTNGSLPEDQDDRILILEEENGCENQLNNVTNASAVILLHDDTRENQYYTTYNFTNYTIQTGRINKSNNNLTTILEMLQNNTPILADNTDNTQTMTFVYNLSYLYSWWPTYDFFIIGAVNASIGIGYVYGGAKQAYILNIFLNMMLKRGLCHGLIIYENILDDVHMMDMTSRYWMGWGNNLLSQIGPFGANRPALQIFSVNKTIGQWLKDNTNNPDDTVTGYFEQEYTQEEHPNLLDPNTWTTGVEAYNVEGNITIQHSPQDKIIVLSNRYDGWSEAPGDSGSGAGVLLAIAKYFKDHNITPKYNLTFLFTCGEEYGFRGAWHYTHSHPPDEYNIIRWIGVDQLGYTRTANETVGNYISAQCKNSTDEMIFSFIGNDSNYTGRTGNLVNTSHAKVGVGMTDDVAWLTRNGCDTITFSKEGGWQRHHLTGKDYTEGDSMKYMNQSDLNASLDVFWNLTKYYTIDPDCWFENSTLTVFDSDDDGLNDSVNATFTVKTILPYDTVRIDANLTNQTDYVVDNETIDFTATMEGVQKTIILTVPEGENADFYTYNISLYNSTGRINKILNISNKSNDAISSSMPFYSYPSNAAESIPDVTNTYISNQVVGYGYQSISLTADVTSEVSGIQGAQVYVYYPDNTLVGYSMDNIGGSSYEYLFDNAWQNGQYHYCYWAEDMNGNTSVSDWHSFNVSAIADISVCTVKDTYTGGEIVNITDPSSSTSGIGYELLDDDQVLHIWNQYDSYYFNTSNGVQFTNHKDQYWSHNVLMLGYYSGNVWNLIYRTDELSGFNKNIVSDDETFVNVTIWKNLSYQGYDFQLAIRYHLGVDDNELTIIPYIKNIDDQNIPYVLGFAWELKDIQIGGTPMGDYIEINGTSYYLNTSVDETYTSLISPCYYILENTDDGSQESLYLRWDENLDYRVKVKSREGQYNAPVTLGIRIGTLAVGQERYTSLFWHDASQITYYWNNYYFGETWTNHPGYMVDGNTSTYASTNLSGDVELCNSNTCNGTDLGDISKLELRLYGYYSGGNRSIILRPIFNGVSDLGNHSFKLSTSPGWTGWTDITSDYPLGSPPDWNWTQVKYLDCDVVTQSGGGSGPPTTFYCSKVEMRVTYNRYPVVSNMYPVDDSTGVPLMPVLGITVNDPEGNSMNISWLSNSSGSWQTFGTNNSIVNGTYHQTFSNASVNGVWWYWKVQVTDVDGGFTESPIFCFYTGNMSTIHDIGGMDIKGYLLIQVQYYNGSQGVWVVADDTVNETSCRYVNSSEMFGLDTVFNGLVSTNDLLSGFGSGIYRVYVAFRDPWGDVLLCDDQSLMEATYEFTLS